MSEYQNVVVKTYRHSTGGSKHAIRAKPLKGQGFREDMFVECSSEMRSRYPIGTYFRLQAKLKSKENGPEFLYSYHGWPYEVLTEQQVKKLGLDP